MALVNNVEELQELLGSLNVTIASIEELRELLQTVAQSDSPDPALRQEWAEWRERQLASAEATRDQAHGERMRALELGYLPALPDLVEARATVLKRTAKVAGTLGVLVTLGALGAAVGGTALLEQRMSQPYLVSILGIIWGVCGLVALVTALVSLGVVRRSRMEALAPTAPRTPEAGFTDKPDQKLFPDNKPLSELVKSTTAD